jgi:hypothetical protein
VGIVVGGGLLWLVKFLGILNESRNFKSSGVRPMSGLSGGVFQSMNFRSHGFPASARDMTSGIFRPIQCQRSRFSVIDQGASGSIGKSNGEFKLGYMVFVTRGSNL